MKIQWEAFLAMMVALCVSASASATLLRYDLRGEGGSLGNPYIFSTNGIDMTAIGEVIDQGEWTQQGSLYQTVRGLGLQNGDDDNIEVDGDGPDESIVFAFDSRKRLTTVLFRSLNEYDDFNLSVYNDNNGWEQVLSSDSNSRNLDYVGTRFRLWVGSTEDDWYVKRVTFQKVPEPATLLLMGVGLAAVGISRRISKL